MEEVEYRKMAQLEEEHFWFLGRRDILRHILQSRLQHLESGKSRILDVGCGTGGNLNWLADYGDIRGIDHSQTACRFAAERHPGVVVRAELPDGVPFQSGIFDLVTLLDVLEHVEDGLATLASMRAMLKPGGALLLSVPAFPHLWSGHDVVHGHKCRYLKSQLKELMETAGLTVDYLSYFNTLLYPAIAMKRIVARVAAEMDRSDMLMPGAAINRILYRIFSFERNWVGRIEVPFGVSLVALAYR